MGYSVSDRSFAATTGRRASRVTRIHAAPGHLLDCALSATGAQANNVTGAWDPQVYTWPLIPVHAVLTPDMRVMTYGTDGIARQTGYFIYDLWDINAGPGRRPPHARQRHRDRHLLRLAGRAAAGRAGVPRRRRQLDRHGHDQHRQQQHQRARPVEQRAQPRQQHESRALVLQLDRAAERRSDDPGRLRRHRSARDPQRSTARSGCSSGANTSTLDFMYPRNFIAPDGRVFGYDSGGPDVLRQPDRHRHDHQRRPVRFGQLSRQRRERGDVPARPHPAVRRHLERRGRHRHHAAARPS